MSLMNMAGANACYERAGGDRFLVTEGEFTFVRIDENRKPVAIAKDP